MSEVLEINTNVAVVATKLKRYGKADRFKKWRETNDFKNIETAVHSNINPNIPVLPLKLSTVFDTIFENE